MGHRTAVAKTDRDDEFCAFVAARRADLVRTATLLVAGDRHRAEDLVQVCLTKMYLAWPRVRRSDGPDGYAHRILVNTFIDERRRPFVRRERPAADVPDSPAAEALSPEDRDAVQLALASLAPRMRAAIVLRYWLELDVAETAAVLRCSRGTVKSQTARALDRLRLLLGPLPDPDAEPAPAIAPRPSGSTR
jgi:RNA polymerase sigma-70 factor (sigma-E family)